VKLTVPFLIKSRLSMSGAVPRLNLYAFIISMCKTLGFCLMNLLSVLKDGETAFLLSSCMYVKPVTVSEAEHIINKTTKFFPAQSNH
jgi:hypothetical protein